MKRPVALFCLLGAVSCAHRQNQSTTPPTPPQSREMLAARSACNYQLEFTIWSKSYKTMLTVFACDGRDLVVPATTQLEWTGKRAMALVEQAFDRMAGRNKISGERVHISVIRAYTFRHWICLVEVGERRDIAYIESEAPFFIILMQALYTYNILGASSTPPQQIKAKYPPRSL